MEMLEHFENTISEVNRYISRPEGTEERISDPEDRLIDIIHTGKKNYLQGDTRRKKVKETRSQHPGYTYIERGRGGR